MNRQLPILNCDECGACCMHVGHPLFLMDWGFPEEPNGEPAWEALPEPLKTKHRRYISELDSDDGEPCYWLDLETRRCMHYEHRPRVCREFEVGEEACLDLRKKAGIDGEMNT